MLMIPALFRVCPCDLYQMVILSLKIGSSVNVLAKAQVSFSPNSAYLPKCTTVTYYPE